MRVYFISGGIGAGKSTLLRLLKTRFATERVAFVFEPVEEWLGTKVGSTNLLGAMYSKEISMATFQFSVVISRLRALRNALMEDVDAVFVERSPFDENFVFAKTGLNEAEYEAYCYMFKGLMQWLDDVPRFDASFVYLKADSAILHERIQNARKREEESCVDVEYLKILEGAHTAMFEDTNFTKQISTIKTVDFHEIDANLDTDVVAETVVSIVKAHGVFVNKQSILKYSNALTRVDSLDSNSITNAEALSGWISERSRAARSAMKKSSKDASPFASPVVKATSAEVEEFSFVLPASIV